MQISRGCLELPVPLPRPGRARACQPSRGQSVRPWGSLRRCSLARGLLDRLRQRHGVFREQFAPAKSGGWKTTEREIVESEPTAAAAQPVINSQQERALTSQGQQHPRRKQATRLAPACRGLAPKA